MAYPTPQVTNTTGAVFIPEIWSDEVIAAYKQNLVMANLVSKMSFKGKKGDTLHIPKPTRGAASAKASSTAVTLIAATETDVQVVVNQHFEYSRFIEDITEVQALSSMRRFYTSDAGYALGKQVDTSIINLGSGLQGGAGTTAYNKAVLAGDGSTPYVAGTTAGTALTDAGIRKMIQTLDDADVPMDGRSIVLPPVGRNVMMGIARFTEQSFVGDTGSGNTIHNGRIGDVYGMMVYVSTNAATPSTATDRIGLMFHKEAFVFAEQMGVRSQTQYKQDYLATLYTADTLYGVKELRDDAGIAFAMLG